MDIQKTIDKIKSFLELEDGWNYTEGIHFKESMIEKSIMILNELNNKFNKFDFKTNVFPSDDGEVLISFIFPIYSLEIIVQNNDLFTYYLEKYDNTIDYWEDISMEILDHKINVIKKLLEK